MNDAQIMQYVETPPVVYGARPQRRKSKVFNEILVKELKFANLDVNIKQVPKQLHNNFNKAASLIKNRGAHILKPVNMNHTMTNSFGHRKR